MDDPIAFKDANYPETINYHQEMRAPDRVEFIKAMEKEVEDRVNSNYWVL